METNKILADYDLYHDVILSLGKMPLKETPDITDLKVSKVQLKCAYKDIKAMDFDGSFIDFICLISLRRVVYSGWMWDETSRETIKNATIKNALRLVIRRPEYYFNEERIESDVETFARLAKLYYKFYQR